MTIRHWPAILLTLSLTFVGWIAWSPLVEGHSWYDIDCCSDDDCRLARPGEIEETAAGIVALGILFPWQSTRLRWSRDGQYHLCIPVDVPICVYRPPGTS